MRFPLFCTVAGIFSLAAAALLAGDSTKPAPIQQDILHCLDALRPELVAVNQDIWTFAELGLQEHRSAARLAGALKKAGFHIKEGVSDMPTAFVTEYGSGKPTIGILAEYDALPELSQQAGDPARHPISGQSAGHGCGHCALGTAAVGAPIGHKGLLVAAKVLALSAVDLLQDPQTLKEARADLQECMKGRPYTTKIPQGRKPPRAIR